MVIWGWALACRRVGGTYLRARCFWACPTKGDNERFARHHHSTSPLFHPPPPLHIQYQTECGEQRHAVSTGPSPYLDDSGALFASHYSYCNCCSYDFGSILLTRRVASFAVHVFRGVSGYEPMSLQASPQSKAAILRGLASPHSGSSCCSAGGIQQPWGNWLGKPARCPPAFSDAE